MCVWSKGLVCIDFGLAVSGFVSGNDVVRQDYVLWFGLQQKV